MEQGRITSRQIVSEYLTRIARYDRLLGATLAVNARALDEADVLDRERAAGRVRGPLARHSNRAQGQHPHDQHADDRRRAGV